MSRKASLSALLSGKTLPSDRDQTDGDDNLAAAKSDVSGADESLAAAKLERNDEADTTHRSPPEWSKRTRSGAIRGMQTSLRSLSEPPGRVEDGSSVIELDPDLIESSMVIDRIGDAQDKSLDLLVESIRDHGQQVPILVRPHPSGQGRYQIAYGHRRWRAAQSLGRDVRVLVRALTDDELVVAQGKENLERRDLSYIERALFAARMVAQGFRRETVWAAMGTVESEISRYIAVAGSVPEWVVSAIGPAPKIGRPRWVAFADRLNQVGLAPIETAIRSDGFANRATDDRFAALFEALHAKVDKPPRTSNTWRDVSGRRIAQYEETAERFSLSIDRRIEPDFGRYLISRLPEILATFKAAEVSPASQRKQKGDEIPE